MPEDRSDVLRRSLLKGSLLGLTGVVGMSRLGSAATATDRSGSTVNHAFSLLDGDDRRTRAINGTLHQIDTEIEIRDGADARTDYEPKQGAKFVATDTGAVFRGDGSAWHLADRRLRSLHANVVNGARYVGTEHEFRTALATASHVVLRNDITATEPIQANRSGDVTVDLGGHVLRRADETPASLLTIDTPGRVWLGNGTVDGNRRGQQFPREKGHKEVTVRNASEATVDAVTVTDNQGFGINAVDVGVVTIDGCTIDSAPAGLGASAAGLDGIHVYDPDAVSISGCSVVAGDDAVAITASGGAVSDVAIDGTFSSPEHANGIRLNVHERATDGARFGSVSIGGTIHDVAGNGVIVNDESNGGGVVAGLDVTGSIESVGGSGVRAKMPVRDASVAATIRDCRRDGVELARGGSNVTVSGSVATARRYGVSATDVTGLRVDGTIDGRGEMSRGVRLSGCRDVSLSPVVRETTEGDHTNGIEADATDHVTVTGAVITGTATPIVTFRGSDHWTVVGNGGHGNRTASPSLSGSNNQVATNNFR